MRRLRIQSQAAQQAAQRQKTTSISRQMAAALAKNEAPDSFQQFSASALFCPKCNRAMPVRERLLLNLPRGDLFDYLCTTCGTSLGTRNTDA